MTVPNNTVSNAEARGARPRAPGAPSSRWFARPAVAHVAALVGYALATIIFTWPLVLNLTIAIPGDSFDGWQNFWNLWWIKIALVERVTSPLRTDILYHPTGVGLYFQTLNPFNGVMTLPLQLAGNLYLAYNAVVFLSWIGAGYGMFLLARWVVGGFVGPFLAGLVFTLAPVHSAHLLGHMQVFSLEWIPFYVLYILRATRSSMAGRGWVRSALLAGLFLAFNGLCDWYFVLYLALFTGLAVLWAWGASQFSGAGPRPSIWIRLWRGLRPALVAGAFFAVVLSFWLAPMISEAVQFRFMVRPPVDLYVFSASAADFVIPNRLHSLFMPGSFSWPGNQIAPVSERTVAVGFVALALALVAIFTARRRAAFWWLTAIFFFLLALGPLIHIGSFTLEDIPPAVLNGEDVQSWTPYGLLNQLVPFMRISRSVSRFAVMVQLSMAVLAGLGLATLLARMQRLPAPGGAKKVAWYASPAAQFGLVFLCIGGLFAEYWVAPFPISPPDTPDYYRTLADDPDNRSVLNLPMNYDRPGYLLYQTVHGKPLSVAYISRDDPRTLTERAPVLQHFRHLGPDIIDVDLAQVGPTVLADLDIGTIVLDRYKMPGGDERTVTEALSQEIFQGQAPAYEDDRITVYKAPAVGAPQPYLVLGPLHWGSLQRPEGGVQYRTLTGPAEVGFAHTAAGAGLRIQYRTSDASTGIRVTSIDDPAQTMELPPAPDGNDVVVRFEGVGSGVVLRPAGAGEVRIEEIGLE